jgi:hypothetical protein
MSERDDFPESVKRVLAERVGYRCSHPECGALTSGPHTEPGKRVSVGVAAHITAAAEGGPRYNPNLTPEERKAPENGMWMCQTHGTLVDRDHVRFQEPMLREWKARAEDEAFAAIGRTGGWPAGEKVVSTLSDRLRAPRPEPDPETIALDLLRKHYAAYMRVVRLIEDIGRLPENSIVNIARSPEHYAKKNALLSKFGEDYAAMQQDLETAITNLEVVRDDEQEPVEKEIIDAIIFAVQEVATTVEAMVAWTQDKHNEPVGLAMLHDRPKVCDDAREAGRHMNKLVAKRLITRQSS